MKFKSFFLLLIFSLSLLPPGPARAEGGTHPVVDDAAALLYLSEAILTDESDLDDIASRSGLFFRPKNRPLASDADPLLARIIHAKKMQRNDLDSNCALLITQLQAQGKKCEADQVQAYCEAKRSEINTQIGFYHRLRGDQRKFFTRAWHSLKRNAESVWYRIGPVGRNLLRNLGEEALQTVSSGGTLSGGTLKNLVKGQIKAMGRQRIREIVYQGVERMLLGQIEIARAAGVDICGEGVTTAPEPKISEKESSPRGGILQYTLTTSDVDFSWHDLLPERDQFHSCGSLWPSNQSEHFKPIAFTLSIDTQSQTISAQIDGQRKIESFAEGETGDLTALQNQTFTALLDGAYQTSEPEKGRVAVYQGTAQLTLAMDGKRYCGYWDCPSGADCVWKDYWVNGADTKNLTTPYQLSVVTYDGETGFLQLILTSQSWGTNSSFLLISQELELSTDDLDALWPK